MRAPAFWFHKSGLLAGLLWPLSQIWKWGAARRAARPSINVGLPVICVGNLTVGGTGKTPVVTYLTERLVRDGKAVHVLSRGYGGSVKGPHRVDPRKDSAAMVGDEPLLLAPFAPVWIGADRVQTAKAAKEAGAEILLMDDGFQNPDLAKDLSIIVIDAATGFGNGRIMPAGPLREPIKAGLSRASHIILIGDMAQRAQFDRSALPPIPITEAEIVPLRTGMDWAGLRCLAFAGIGRPEKFFATLQSLGAELVATHSFADHAPYPPALFQRLKREASQAGAQLVTTEKDAVRLPAEARGDVLALPVRLEVADARPLDAALAQLSLASSNSENLA